MLLNAKTERPQPRCNTHIRLLYRRLRFSVCTPVRRLEKPVFVGGEMDVSSLSAEFSSMWVQLTSCEQRNLAAGAQAPMLRHLLRALWMPLIIILILE